MADPTGIAPDVVAQHGILQRLTEVERKSGAPERERLSFDSQYADTLVSLSGVGVIEGSLDDGWALAEAGLQQLQVAWVAHGPQLVRRVRHDVPIKDWTYYEALVTLKAQGLDMVNIPSMISARSQLDAYALGRKKIWYDVLSTSLRDRMYLLCLLFAEACIWNYPTRPSPPRAPQVDWCRK